MNRFRGHAPTLRPRRHRCPDLGACPRFSPPKSVRVPGFFLALALAAGEAWAAGLSIPDLGATAFGQGGAFVARPTDMEAIYYNPAGLAGQEGLRAQLDTRAVNHDITFQRLAADGTNPLRFEPVTNDGGLGTSLGLHASVAPLGGVSWQLQTRWMPITVALGGHPAAGYTGYQYIDPKDLRSCEAPPCAAPTPAEAAEWARLAPQRYTSIAANSKVYTPVLAVAARATKWMDLGIALQSPVAFFDTRQAIYAFTVPVEDMLYDAIFEIHAQDSFTPSAVFGASFELPFGLLAGLALQLPWEFHAEGKVAVEIPDNLKGEPINAKVFGDAADLTITFPMVLRGGLRLVRPSFEVELAGTYDRWSALEKIVLDPKGRIEFELLGKRYQLPKIEIEKYLKDAGSVRLGAELKPGGVWKAWDWLTVRLGLLRESSAVPLARQGLDMVHWQRWSLSAGLGLKYGRYAASLGYAHFIQPVRKVRDSKVLQVVAVEGTPRAVVGNGDYTSQVDLAGLMMAVRFDP